MSRDLLNKSIKEAAFGETAGSGNKTCKEDACIFLAKVVRFEDNQEVLLMELHKLPGREEPSTWHESKNSFIFPVDIAWDKYSLSYHLRSTIDNI